MKAYRLGRGWKRIGGTVYARPDGVRISMLGSVKLTNGNRVCGSISIHAERIAFLNKITGGNRKRSLMIWANELERDIANK